MVGYIEGCSTILLMGVAVPLKYLASNDLMVKIMGPIRWPMNYGYSLPSNTKVNSSIGHLATIVLHHPFDSSRSIKPAFLPVIGKPRSLRTSLSCGTVSEE